MGILLCFIPFRIAILYVLWSHNIIFKITQIIEKSINWSDRKMRAPPLKTHLHKMRSTQDQLHKMRIAEMDERL